MTERAVCGVVGIRHRRSDELGYSTAMASTAQLLAKMLITGHRGYAGAVSSALLEEHPEFADAAGPGAFDLWKVHFEERLSELIAALEFQRPELFARGAHWARVAVEARKAPVEHFVTALAFLQRELTERLPPGSGEILRSYFESAREAIEKPARLDLDLSHRAALEFLQQTLEGRARAAASVLLEQHAAGASVADLFEHVVVPAQREVGSMWHRGEINVAEEHVATLTTQKAVAVLAHQAEAEAPQGYTVVVGSVTGDNHDLGSRLLAELFELAGWRSVSLGADVPRLDLLQALEGFEADLLVLSATLSRHLITVRSTIELVRTQIARPELKVLVGGRAFAGASELWREVGADGWSPTLTKALAEAERLVRASSP